MKISNTWPGLSVAGVRRSKLQQAPSSFTIYWPADYSPPFGVVRLIQLEGDLFFTLVSLWAGRRWGRTTQLSQNPLHLNADVGRVDY